jgi:ubiquinone/menaquinone biosynthesis C-methylase UbiE
MEYYKNVSSYYDNDAANFEKRYGNNPLLQQIRESFREESKPYVGKKILEIGYGPGFDLAYFATTFPDSEVYGIDISEEMMLLAQKNTKGVNIENVHVSVGSVEDIATNFPNTKFDFIYVYFGALNTVEHLDVIAKHLQDLLTPEGKMTLTFINKYFLSLIIKNLVHGRFKAAFARLGKIWGGYSPYRHLDSRCYSYKEIRTVFSNFDILSKRGYSISYPAWYEYQKFTTRPSLLKKLWSFDMLLNKTMFWQLGEYALYHMKHKDSKESR